MHENFLVTKSNDFIMKSAYDLSLEEQRLILVLASMDQPEDKEYKEYTLKNKEFMVYYQPKVCIKTNRIFGFEALVRWQHPELGLVRPDMFIPLAEESS